MKAAIIPIGNSKGIRIPKSMLDQCGFEKSVEIEVKGDRLVLCPTSAVRSGWEEAFEAMAAKKEDGLLDSTPTAFEVSDWQW